MPKVILTITLPILAFLLLSGCPTGKDSECSSDQNCPSGRYCQSGSCAFDCTLDNDCPDGYRCTLRGRCERGCAVSNGGIEACDEIDNDCDGQTDEDFTELGLSCQNGDCPAGKWICAADQLGLVCDGPRPAADDPSCDGVDQDCDGQTDEDVLERDCPLQAGVCQGSQQTCQDGSWLACDYGPQFTADLDDVCDLLDNDCDGLTDEDGQTVQQGEFGQEASDGMDNNCNGMIDEPGGVMVKLDDSLAIDAFEAAVYETADCSGQLYGINGDDYPTGFPTEGEFTVNLFACSMPQHTPSGYLSYHRAQQVCLAQGKRLCTSSEYGQACSGAAHYPYPYGALFASGACNDGWVEDRGLSLTGSYAQCTSGNGTWDMSGNMAEWVSDLSPLYPGCATLAAAFYGCQLCGPDGGCWDCDQDDFDHQSWWRSMADCVPEIDRVRETYPMNGAKDRFGVRCCMDLQ